MKHAVAILTLALFASCGPPDDDGPDVISGNNPINNTTTGTNNTTTGTTGTNNTTAGTNNATTSTNNEDDACTGIVCDDPTRKCVKGICVLADLNVACESPIDLGEVDLDSPASGSGETSNFADALETSCAADDGFSGAENVIHFTVPQPARVNFRLTSIAAVDWVVEVRTDSCTDPADPLVCSDVEDFLFVAEPGTDYYLVVEPASGIDQGAFDFEMDFTELVCSPPGAKTCAGDDVSVCLAGTSQQIRACGTGCSGGACLGDSCDNPFAVTASMSIAGDTNAYASTLDFSGEPTCSESGDAGIATPGAEIVLSLPGLTAGQTVTIDAGAPDTNDNGIFILDDCSDQVACLAAVDLGETLAWDVPADGSYFIVIDKLSDTDNPFLYGIDIQ